MDYLETVYIAVEGQVRRQGGHTVSALQHQVVVATLTFGALT